MIGDKQMDMIAQIKLVQKELQRFFVDFMEIQLYDVMKHFENFKQLPITYLQAYSAFMRLFKNETIDDLNEALNILLEKHNPPQLIFRHAEETNSIKPDIENAIGMQVKITFMDGSRAIGFIFIPLLDFQTREGFILSFHKQFKFGMRIKNIFIVPGCSNETAPNWLKNSGMRIIFD